MKPITFTLLETFESVQMIKRRVESKTKEELLSWALAELVSLFELVELPKEALLIYNDVLQRGITIPVQEGRKLALKIHAIARAQQTQSTIFTLRALGHSVATIHVKDHAYGMVLYSLKAYYECGYSIQKLENIALGYQKRLG